MKPGILFISTLLLAAGALSGAESENRYLAWGAPVLTQTWTGSDYLALGRMMEGESGQLPTYADADGKAVLERAFNLENFAIYHDYERPIQGRLLSLSQVQAGLKNAFAAYASAANTKDAKVGREAADCLAMLVRSNAVLLDLVDESLVMAPTGGSEAVQVEKGVDAMRTTVLQIVDGAEASLSERTFYTAADRSNLLQALSDTFPRVRPLFTEQQAHIFRDRLQKRIAQFSEDKDTRNLASMLQALGAPLSPTAPN